MAKPLFDISLRALRRDRAFRSGVPSFLHERAFADVLERLELVHRQFRAALLIGCLDSRWPGRLARIAQRVEVVDPGPAFARAVGGRCLNEDEERLGFADFDLCVAIGTLDTVNSLPIALANIRATLRPDALLIGAISGGNSLPRLRAAMRQADAVMGTASPRIHPRIDGPALCALLAEVGFGMPVVDVDRVTINYQSLRALVSDLRAAAATNILAERSAIPLSRPAIAAASNSFNPGGETNRAAETIEILHFAAWTESQSS